VIHCRRSYYYCRRCGKGFFPWDNQVGLTERNLTPALEQVACLTGAVADSFERGAELLEKTAGVRLSESTVQRTTEMVGERIAERLGAGKTFGPKKPWDWYRDANGQRVAYVGIDATGVPQQGEKGGKVDGRMAYVGVVYNPLPDLERTFSNEVRKGARMQARYVSGLYRLEQMGPLLRRQGAQVGMDDADVWIALSDGGSGLEAFLEMNFPRVEAVIIDFWHASEYVAKLAKALHPNDDAQALAQTRQWKRILQEEGGWTLLAIWETWDWPTHRSAELTAVREEVLGYFRNQGHRMEYPEYEANGWCIGSGAVESGCKTVVSQRLKGAGMRWCEAGAHAVCHVRALYRSEAGQWESFWQRDLQLRTAV
jgi:hypothetical protein